MQIAIRHAGLGLTPMFKCSLIKCYSTDGQGVNAGTHLLFLNLQRTINRYAGVAGFSPITVDGFIGSGTVTAFQKAATWALAKSTPFATGNARYYQISTSLKGVAPLATSKTMLASMAQQAYDALALGTEMITSPTVPTTPPSPGTPGPTPQFPADPNAYAPPPKPPNWAKANWSWLAAGGILLAGLGTATYFVFKPVEPIEEM